MKIKIINGANLNMLGIREVDIYGTCDYDSLVTMIKKYCLDKNIEVDIIQSNYEGKIIEEIHNVYFDKYDALIINPGAFTHYSYAIFDALKILKCLVVEVHITNINSRENFRKVNVIKDATSYSIIGKGINGYIDAINYVIENHKQ